MLRARLVQRAAVIARRSSTAVRQQNRAFSFGIKSPVASSPGGVFVTKYEIVRPAKEGVDWDDFLLAHPSKDALASSGKEVPLFLKYLKMVTDKEDRKDDFAAFLKRAKDGLQVESDVYLTTEELLAVMWKNGYLDNERNSLQFTFPSDYKFHYPELAVLFDLSEEDTYKFCMKQRMEKSHIGQVKSVAKPGWVRDHWLIFGAGAFIFKTFPFFNYYFVLKGFGTAMWVWSCYTVGNRYMANVIARNEFNCQQKTAADVMEGEDRIMAAMERFANDSNCIKGVKGFKKEIDNGSMAEYRKALIQTEKAKLIEKANKQLSSILSFEESTNSKLQDTIVKEIASEFKDKFSKDAKLQKEAFDAAIMGLNGNAKDDPVTKHFVSSLGSIDFSGKAKPNPAGSISERIAALQATQEAEFLKTFYLSQGEISAAKTAEDKDAAYTALFNKIGFHVPGSFDAKVELPEAKTGSSKTDGYLSEAAKEIEKFDAQIKKQREEAFAGAFA